MIVLIRLKQFGFQIVSFKLSIQDRFNELADRMAPASDNLSLQVISNPIGELDRQLSHSLFPQ